MKKIFQFIGVCLFVSAISFSFVSCSDDYNVEEDVKIEDEVSLRETDPPTGPTGPYGLTWEGYYTSLSLLAYFPSGIPNTNNPVTWEAFFENYEQCDCFTQQWLDRITPELLTPEGAKPYIGGPLNVWCVQAIRNYKPYGALCN